MAGSVGTAFVDVELDPTGIRRGLDKTERDVKSGFQRVEQTGQRQLKSAGEKSGKSFREGFGGAIRGMGPAFEKALIPATVALGAITVAAKKSIDAASNLNEQMNKTGVVFGKSSKDVLDWSKDAATAFGMSRREALEATGVFGNMLVPMGFARKEAAGMSQRMVRLAADMASFNNADPSDTLDAIRSGLAGEAEPLRKYGVFLSDVRIKQEAFNLGLTAGSAAVAASKDALKAATSEVASAQKAATAAARELSSAQSGVASAQKALETANKSVAASQDGVRASSEAVTNAEDRQKAASERLRDAKLALRDAQAKAKATQEALTDARKRATEQLEALKDSARDAALSEERASIGVERARARLDEVTKDAGATDLDKREAALALKEAEANLTDAQEQRQSTTADLADAEKKGVEGSDAVVAAKKAIADADEAAERAASRVAAAQRSYAASQRAVASALRGLVKSQAQLTDSRERASAASRALVQSQERLNTAENRSKATKAALSVAQERENVARERANKLSKEAARGLTAQQKAQAIYSLLLKDSKDANHDFERTSSGVANQQRILKARMEDTQAELGKKLIPAQQRMNKLSLRFFDLLSKNTDATFALVGAFAALSGIVIAVNLAMKAYRAITVLVDAATKAWTAVQWLLNVALNANPIGLVVVAVAALVAAFVIAYKQSDTFRKAIDALWGSLKDFLNGFVQALKDVLGWIGDHWKEIVPLLAGPFAPLVLLATDGFGIRSALIDFFSGIVKFIGDKASDVYSAAKDFGVKLKDGVVNGVTGAASAVWDVLLRIGTLIAQKASDVLGWGKDVGVKLKNAVLDGVTGVASGVWEIVRRIGDKFAEVIATVKAWGTAVGGWIASAIVEAVKGVKDGVWNIVKTIGDKFAEMIDVVKAWGTAVGNWIRDAIVEGITGLAKALKKKLKGALKGVGGAIGGLNPFSAVAPMPTPEGVFLAGPLEVAATGLLGAPRAGAGGDSGLAGPMPTALDQLRYSLDHFEPAQPETPDVHVRVFIGERELEDIVRVQVRTEDARTARVLLGGVS